MKRFFSICIIVMLFIGIGGSMVNAFEDVPDELNEFEEKYNISYYRSGNGTWISGFTDVAPLKVFSAAELTNLFSQSIGTTPDIISKYEASFFANKFLLFIPWKTGTPNHGFRISSVYDDGERMNIEVTKDYSTATMSQAMEYGFIVFEMDNALSDRDFAVTTVRKPYRDIERVAVSGSDVKVTLNRAKLDEHVLTVAAYDNGKLLSVSKNAAETETPGVYDILDALPPGATMLKIFLWDDMATMQPLCKAVTKMI